MANTYTLISSNVLTSSAASVTFSSIPSTYTDLVLKISARIAGTGGSTNFTLAVSMNGNSATNHSYTVLRGTGTATANSFAASNVTNINGVSTADGAAANTFGSAEFYLPSYIASQNKPASFYSVSEENSTTIGIRSTAGLYSSTSAVTSLVIWSQSGQTLDTGSSFYLYGIKNS